MTGYEGHSPVSAEAIAQVPTPCFVISEAALRRNAEILARVRERTGVKILLALKAFALSHVFPLLRRYLDGVCATGPYEARLGREEFGGEVHAGAPAYSDADMRELCQLADHLVFNTCSQWVRHRATVHAAQRDIACGLRVNPEHSEAPVPIYSPCGPHSRLGTTRAELDPRSLEGISGLHMHALCEQNADAFERTLAAFESHFGEFVPRMEWINFGGGHHITRDDYDIGLLCELLNRFIARYGVARVYLEPGEAVALNAGVLVTSVLDTMRNEGEIAIVDTSASAHMPDVIEMPYRPDLLGAGAAGEKAYTCWVGGLTCLTGDVMGEYSFDAPLETGTRLVFMDMAHYTLVKTTMFNGVKHPAVVIERENGTLEHVTAFSYDDYRRRMG